MVAQVPQGRKVNQAPLGILAQQVPQAPWDQLVPRAQEVFRERQVQLDLKVILVIWDLQESREQKVIRVHKVLRASQESQEQQVLLVPGVPLELLVAKVTSATQVQLVHQGHLEL